MLRRASIGALVALLVAGTHGEAQTAQRFSIQGSVLGAQLTAVENEDLKFGAGGELQLRWNPSSFSIGLGVQGTRHELGSNSFTFGGAFIEPRYVLVTMADRVALYGSLRLMALTASVEVLGAEVQVDGSGYSAGGGLLIGLGSRVNADIGITAGKERYEGRTADGTTVVTRLGLAVGVG